MPVFKFQFDIEAETQERARQIAQSLNTIYKKINKDDLVWVANKINEDPKVIEKVKKVANNPIVKKLF
jgi:hypothetical protein